MGAADYRHHVLQTSTRGVEPRAAARHRRELVGVLGCGILTVRCLGRCDARAV